MLTEQEVICALRKLLNQIYDASDVEQVHRLIDEFLEKYEIWTRLKQSPIILLGRHYWRHYLAWVEDAAAAGLISPWGKTLLTVTDDNAYALEILKKHCLK